jgi:hypothetical protein
MKVALSLTAKRGGGERHVYLSSLLETVKNHMTSQNLNRRNQEHDLAFIYSLQQEEMHHHPGLRFVPAN